ncbi:hypothetical protein GOP47_0023731 [Adiantum capillus-veneris]|uniref:Uncharacterized protein n=1 Tax=Adiantum capillus-veneris TaxID=13818 RepID=A0A9D4Z673_ADICA|nr:hypothetical protein GOP47_0023731 [Adiantum capillus-veneris]
MYQMPRTPTETARLSWASSRCLTFPPSSHSHTKPTRASSNLPLTINEELKLRDWLRLSGVGCSNASPQSLLKRLWTSFSFEGGRSENCRFSFEPITLEQIGTSEVRGPTHRFKNLGFSGLLMWAAIHRGPHCWTSKRRGGSGFSSSIGDILEPRDSIA